ncbi:MAG: hypothetical protein JO159_04270 [Acidobacteria bacterium]|nr:hypothetical protein [Acidobacteriota bacterium]
MNGLTQELRYGLRQLRSSPGFTTTAVLALAPAIGENTAIFSLVNALFLSSRGTSVGLEVAAGVILYAGALLLYAVCSTALVDDCRMIVLISC